MKNIVQFAAVAIVLVVVMMWIFGYKSCPQVQVKSACYVVQAVYAKMPVNVDGRLDDEVWQHARAYPMRLSIDRIVAGLKPQEEAIVRLASDKEYFSVELEWTDSDIVAEGAANHRQLFNMIGVCYN